MEPILKWGIVLAGGITLFGSIYLILSRNKKNKVQSEKQFITNNILINDKIVEFLDDYKKEWKKYRYINFYSKQFDIDTDINTYEMKMKRISSVYDLSIEDRKQAFLELLHFIKDKIGQISKSLNEGECLYFLQNILELESEKEILEEINGKISEKDSERYIKYKEDVNSRIKDLIIDFKK